MFFSVIYLVRLLQIKVSKTLILIVPRYFQLMTFSPLMAMLIEQKAKIIVMITETSAGWIDRNNNQNIRT